MMCNVSTLDDAERELFNLKKLKESGILWDLKRERDALNARIADLEAKYETTAESVEAARVLSGVIGRSLEIHINPSVLRGFIRSHWTTLKHYAHKIHEGD
jgi:hypothetical protein